MRYRYIFSSRQDFKKTMIILYIPFAVIITICLGLLSEYILGGGDYTPLAGVLLGFLINAYEVFFTKLCDLE